VDARARVGGESVVTDSQGTSVGASGVIIDGFTIQDSVNNAFTGYGIFLNPGISGTRILNNIIQNNIVGIGLANGTGALALIQHNLIWNNNAAGGASGTGIYTDQFVGGSVTRNVLIEENAFTGHDDAGIDVSNTDPAGGVFDLTISTNSFDLNGRATVLFNRHNSTIFNNTNTNSTLTGSAAIRLFDNNSGLTILSNNVTTGDARVRIKAETINGLFISSPGTSCPATPGSKHAKFTGTAAVIRSAGTTHESFTVDVDDCGEPGFNDTFGIQTTTYANGPNTLLGGNIQIHK
jgi:hypothetical protein